MPSSQRPYCMITAWLLISLTVLPLISCQDDSARESPELSGFVIAVGDSTGLQAAIDTSHARLRRYLHCKIDSLIRKKADAGDDCSVDFMHTQWLVETYTACTGITDLAWRLSFAQRLSAGEATLKVRRDSHFIDIVTQFRRHELIGGVSAYFDSLSVLKQSCEECGDSAMVAAIYSYLAHACYDDNQVDATMKNISLCLSYCHYLGLRELEANARLLRAKALSVFFADYAAGDRERRRALELYGDIGLYERRINVSTQWAFLLHQLHKPQQAVSVLKEALEECVDIGDLLNQAYCTNLLAECYLDLGVLDSSLTAALRSLDLYQILSDSLKLPDHRSGLGYAQSTIGVIEATRASHNEALRWFDQSHATFISANDRRGQAVNAGRKASHLLERGMLAVAEELFADILSTSPKFETQILALYGLATCRHLSGDLDQSQALAEACVHRYEVSRNKMPLLEMRTGMLSDKVGFYYLLSVIHIERYERNGSRAHLDSALATLERSRAQTLLDQLATDEDDISPIERDLIASISLLQTRLLLEEPDDENLRNQLTQLEDSLQQLRLTLAVSQPVVRHLAAAPDLGEIQSRLDAQEVLLEYLVSSHGSYVIVVDRGTVEIQKLSISVGELRNRVAEYVDLLSRYPSPEDLSSGSLVSLGRAIRDQIWPTGRVFRDHHRHVIIAPSGILHHLPFEVLPDENGNPITMSVAISYIPSFGVLQAMLASDTVHQTATHSFAIGSPTLPSSSALPPLVHSSTELAAVAHALGRPTVVISGDSATRERINATDLQDADIIHFATHALCDPVHPSRSALVFSFDTMTSSSGFMRADEIRQLRLGAPLVFLSCCRTADGMLIPGEGVMGLARTFIETGARTVVATRWTVNDRSSVKFAASFYLHLQASGSAAAALAAARREMLSSPRPLYRHPYFWAPYVLVGK